MKKTARAILCVLLSMACFFLFTGVSPARSRTEPDSQPPAKHFNDIKLPRGYRPPPALCRQFRGKDLAVDLFAEGFAQGMAVYVEAYPDVSAQNRKFEVRKIIFDGKEAALSKRNWGCRSLFGISPETVPGQRSLQVLYTVDGESRMENFAVPVSRTEYRFTPGALDLGRYSDLDYRPTSEEMAFINKCAAKKNMVFGRTGPDMLGGSYSHPRTIHYITSPFWSKRQIMQYRKNNRGRKIRHKDKLNIHKGIDLRGNAGEPVFSMADGKVVIAEPMYYEGNFVVIDHGNRIFSYFMHMSSFKVKEGDTVKGGQQIGCVGSTGLSTAAHLHVSLMIQEVNVDPLSILMLPVRN